MPRQAVSGKNVHPVHLCRCRKKKKSNSREVEGLGVNVSKGGKVKQKSYDRGATTKAIGRRASNFPFKVAEIVSVVEGSIATDLEVR